MPLLSIQQISLRTDIPKSTLRFWEKHFSTILKPIRSSGGQRRYTDEHIAVLKGIKNLRDSGLSLSEIKQKMEPMTDEPVTQHPEIEILATRLGQIVRDEIYRFYQQHLNDR